MNELIQTITVYALPVLFAITVNEAAHGYVARLFGDNTAAQAGRITLNPLPHIDPIGTIAVPLFLLITSTLMGGTGLLFGWAKPVPVDWSKLRKPKRDMMWVALSGPASNLLMAIGWAIALRLMLDNGVAHTGFFPRMAIAGIWVNLVLMALNLMPLPPLDGGRIVFSLLPNKWAYHYSRLEPYGMLILIVLLVTNVLGLVLAPFLSFGQSVVSWFL